MLKRFLKVLLLLSCYFISLILFELVIGVINFDQNTLYMQQHGLISEAKRLSFLKARNKRMHIE